MCQPFPSRLHFTNTLLSQSYVLHHGELTASRDLAYGHFDRYFSVHGPDGCGEGTKDHPQGLFRYRP
jgi:hypothetical protein